MVIAVEKVSGLGIDDLLNEKRGEILQLAEKYGASNVRVFGSVARGEATEQSDIDLLVTAAEDATVFDMVGLWRDLQALLGREVSLISDGLDDERFLQIVQEEAVPL